MESIDVGSIRQLFLDDHVVDRVEAVQRQFHRPRRCRQNPILEPDRPWEQSGGGVYLFGGTVLYDEDDRVFKMWYRTSTELVETPDPGTREEPDGVYRSCYATSEDGLEWEKPALGLSDFAGSKQNNLLPPAAATGRQVRRPNLIKDYEESDPGRRYKMVYMDRITGRWALCKGYSADGIRWQMNVGEPVWFEPPVVPNGILFGWDPRRREFVHYHRKNGRLAADVDGRSVRTKVAVMRTSSPDFETWGSTSEALMRRQDDPPRWDPSHGVDLAGVLYTDDLYIGFVDSVTSHYVEDVPEDLWEEVYADAYAEYRTEMVMSRDGSRWRRLCPHWEFMRPGLWGAWDSDHIGLSKPIVKDDEVLIYYSGSNLPMGATGPYHPQRGVVSVSSRCQRLGHAIGLARMRLDGFVSMEAYESGGTLTTRPIRFDGDRLVVNVRAPDRAFGAQRAPATPHGSMDIEVLDADGHPLPGYTCEDCDTFTGDEVNLTVTWRGEHDLEHVAQPVRLRFCLTNAALYAFQFAPGDPVPGLANSLSPGCRGVRPGS